MRMKYKKWNDKKYKIFEDICEEWIESSSLILKDLYLKLGITRQNKYYYKKSNPKIYACIEHYKDQLEVKITELMLNDPKNYRGYQTYLKLLNKEWNDNYQDIKVKNETVKENAPVNINLDSNSDIKIGDIDG